MRFDHILFLGAEDARTQLAVGLARARFGPDVRVGSAGSAPVQPLVVQTLAEVGLACPDPTTDSEAGPVDLVIGLDPDAVCPPGLAHARHLQWNVPDPSAAPEGLDASARMDPFRRTRDGLARRLDILAALRDVPPPLVPLEFHASVRVPDLPQAARFYTWLLGVEPKEWTHRYVTFVSEALRTNFVVVVDDGLELHQDTLYHLGIELPDRAAVIDAHHRAVAAGWTVHKPARTTWRGTPFHELWLKDPGGNLVELYARLTDEERATMPADKEPVFLVEGTG